MENNIEKQQQAAKPSSSNKTGARAVKKVVRKVMKKAAPKASTMTKKVPKRAPKSTTSPASSPARSTAPSSDKSAKVPSRHNTPKDNFRTELQVSKAPKGSKKLEEQNEKIASDIKKQKDKQTRPDPPKPQVKKILKKNKDQKKVNKQDVDTEKHKKPDLDTDQKADAGTEHTAESARSFPGTLPAQHQSRQPGKESKMRPTPKSAPTESALPGRQLVGKTAIITGGDSGIGKAVALLFATHGAHITVVYKNETKDAKKTEKELKKLGAKTLFMAGDITDQAFCISVIEETLHHFSNIDILINNAAVQYPQKNPENITQKQLIKTFSTNIFAAFYFVTAALPYMKKGSCIINTTSVTAYRGSKHLIDYAATKGALVAFTRSLSTALIKRQIRVNAVAPGPVWTPLIPASFSKEKVGKFGQDVPMGRPGQPTEIAPCYLFLATDQSSYITGQVLHPNGGEIVNT